MFIIRSLHTGLRMLVTPNMTVDALEADPNAKGKAWFFLVFSAAGWMALTLYVNLVLEITSRGREAVLGISFGPDLLVTLLTVPAAIAAVSLSAVICRWVFSRMGVKTDFWSIFTVLAFSLNAGSFFFDLPHEFAWALTLPGNPWEFSRANPQFFMYTAVVMAVSILWSLAVTVIALARSARVMWPKALLAFLISVLPVFSALIFLVM